MCVSTRKLLSKLPQKHEYHLQLTINDHELNEIEMKMWINCSVFITDPTYHGQ